LNPLFKKSNLQTNYTLIFRSKKSFSREKNDFANQVRGRGKKFTLATAGKFL